MNLQQIFMYIDNRQDYGHLVSADNFDTSHNNNELYQIVENKYDFESRYVHADYRMYLEENRTLHEVKLPSTKKLFLFLIVIFTALSRRVLVSDVHTPILPGGDPGGRGERFMGHGRLQRNFCFY
jgi:hypothetical protein